jgi:Tfp pilus assembly protein PilF
MYPSHETGRILAAIELRKYDLALKEITIALSKDPESAYLYFLQGLCFQEQGKSTKAIDSFEESLALDPDNLLCHETLALLFYNTGTPEDGIEHIEYCLKSSTENAGVLAIASLLYMDKHPFKSDRLFKQAQIIDPTDSIVEYAESIHAIMGLKLNKFKKILIRNMAENPESKEAMHGMGAVEISRGNFEEAASLLQEAYAFSPSPSLLDAWIDARLGKYIPFKWIIPWSWIGFLFVPNLQILVYSFFLFFTVVIIDKNPTYCLPWSLYLLGTVAFLLSLIYLVKYPIQYIYKRIYHSENPWVSHHDLVKLQLGITTIIFWLQMQSFNFAYLLCTIFGSIHLLLWHFVKARTLFFTKFIMYSLYFGIWGLFAVNVFCHFLNIETYKWLSFPLLIWLIAVLFLDSSLIKLEEKYNDT